jgi:hypothetical protein
MKAYYQRKGADLGAPPETRKSPMGDCALYRLEPPLEFHGRNWTYVFATLREDGFARTFVTTKYGTGTGECLKIRAPVNEVPGARSHDDALAALGYSVEREEPSTAKMVRLLPGTLFDWQALFELSRPVVDITNRREDRFFVVLREVNEGQMSGRVVPAYKGKCVREVRDLGRQVDLEALRVYDVTPGETLEDILWRAVRGHIFIEK